MTAELATYAPLDKRFADLGPAAGGVPFDRRPGPAHPEGWIVVEPDFVQNALRRITLPERGSVGLSVLSADEQIVPDPLVAEYFDARLAFVRHMGWLPGIESDEDKYDRDPSSRYYLAHGSSEDEALIAGMRLTQIGGSYEDGLSWSMLAGSNLARRSVQIRRHRQKLQQLQTVANRGDLWDLTRLVPGTTPPDRRLRSAVQQLVGAAMAETALKPDRHPLWYFMTTDTFKRNLLDASGIRSEALYSGILHEGDQEQSHFCVVDPLHAFDYLRRSPQRRLQRTCGMVALGARKYLDETA